MPHLSPMFWILSPLMYMSILTLMLSSMWWIHYPNFPSLYSKTTSTYHQWMWE